MGVLSDKPLFVLISSYSTGLAPSVMSYLLGITAGKRADILVLDETLHPEKIFIGGVQTK